MVKSLYLEAIETGALSPNSKSRGKMSKLIDSSERQKRVAENVDVSGKLEVSSELV